MLTPAQLKAAARALCKARGIDPDGQVLQMPDPDPSGRQQAPALQSPAWRLMAKEIRRFEQVQEAVARAASLPLA